MPLTLEQIIEETRQWSPEEVGELVSRLTSDLHTATPEHTESWKREINLRLEAIQSGKVKAVPTEEVFAEAKKLLLR